MEASVVLFESLDFVGETLNIFSQLDFLVWRTDVGTRDR